ncbi:conserved hypothetical protein [Anaeromyxobacter dehalogenans 2CP-1]|uniref:Alginate export domain-containing protein n=1 Tax=Anaeromyxobacter dehalogenans (strain ATCC BAA-258 / DSM 21875 / 2CP-1) TaxID=455488 RepID=B8J9K7_ANAD2|nr:hypothetical protein [Anaeromyxobacter dehalogenans]ACL67395.1 conserved hypothetical protein [Anaeromyxobacter dehalogenans 2CP-1]
MPSPRTAALLAAAALCALPGRPASAQDRPSEDDLFGAPAAPPAAAAPAPEATRGAEGTAPAPAPAARDRGDVEAELFGSRGSPNAVPPPPEGIISREREDPLRIGGQLYLRTIGTWQEGVDPADWYLASPNLLDTYLDARPNDRVRAFVLGRMSYDPTLSRTSVALTQPSAGVTESAATAASNPRGTLDQLWVNFDLGRRAFVTAGKQHVKWGVGKFWNPTDFLHPSKRDPLAVYDARSGTSMVKVHVPWEARGWNFYGVLAFEDLAGEARATDRVGRVGAGGRAELVAGTAELGLDAMVQDGHRPRFGVDLSGGLGDFDLYAEAALRTGTDGPRWRKTAPTLTDPFGYAPYEPRGFTPQIVLGGSWSANYSDEDAVLVGAEYFFDDAGYSDADVYPFLAAGAPRLDLTNPAAPALVQQDPTAFRPFYLGRHYAGTFVTLPKPGRWNNTIFTLSALGNLSDRTFVVRLDHSVLALTYLRVETFVAGHMGRKGGELRFAYEVPAGAAAFLGASPDPRLGKAPVLDAGVALRVSL